MKDDAKRFLDDWYNNGTQSEPKEQDTAESFLRDFYANTPKQEVKQPTNQVAPQTTPGHGFPMATEMPSRRIPSPTEQTTPEDIMAI